MMSEIYVDTNIFKIILDLPVGVKYDLTSDLIFFRPLIKVIYIYIHVSPFSILNRWD